MNWKKIFHPKANLEEKILQISILLGSIINLVGISVAWVMDQEIWMVVQGYISLVIFGWSYYLTRFKGKHKTAVVLFAFIGWIILQMAWVTNDGSRGPVLTMLAFAGLIIIVTMPRAGGQLRSSLADSHCRL